MRYTSTLWRYYPPLFSNLQLLRMQSKIIVPAVIGLALVASLPVFAEETGGSNATSTSSVATTTSDGSLRDRIEQMRQKISAFKAGAKEASDSGRKHGIATSLKNASSTCIQKLSDTREVTLQTAWTAFSSSTMSNLKTRQSAIYSAWGLSTTSARATALNAAWHAWKTAQNDTIKKLNVARRTAWKTFKADARTECKVNVPQSEGLAPDTTGTIAL